MPETACKPTDVILPRGPTSGASPLLLVAETDRSSVGGASRLTDWSMLLPPIGQDIAYPYTLLTQHDNWRASLFEMSAALEHHRPKIVLRQGLAAAPAREPPSRPPACPATPATPASVTSGSSGTGGGRDGSILALFLAGTNGLMLAGGATFRFAILAPRQRAERIIVPPN